MPLPLLVLLIWLLLLLLLLVSLLLVSLLLLLLLLPEEERVSVLWKERTLALHHFMIANKDPVSVYRDNIDWQVVGGRW